MSVPIYKPYLTDGDADAVAKAVKSGWISWRGPAVDVAEARVAKLTGTRHAILTCNGTAATHCLWMAVRLKRPDLKRIYVPDSVYVAAWNGIMHEYGEERALDLVRVLPTDAVTWNMCSDEETLMSLEKYAALLVVHNVGCVVNVPRIARLRPDIMIVEDACEALFGTYEEQPVGSCCVAASVSFFSNKTVTCGEGGAVVCNDDQLARELRLRICQGQSDVPYVHTVLGYNYRITNIQAALLNSQLDGANAVIGLKRRVFQNYRLAIRGADESIRKRIITQRSVENCEDSGWFFAVRIAGSPGYEAAKAFFSERGVETRPMFYTIRTHAHWKDAKYCDGADDAVGKNLSKECIMLPSFPSMTTAECDRVSAALISFVQSLPT